MKKIINNTKLANNNNKITVLEINNLALPQIQKNPQQFINNLLSAINSNQNADVKVGTFANYVQVFQPVPQFNDNIFIQFQGTVYNLNPNDPKFKMLSQYYPSYVNDMCKSALQLISNCLDFNDPNLSKFQTKS